MAACYRRRPRILLGVTGSVAAVKGLIKVILQLKKKAAKDALSTKVLAKTKVVAKKLGLKRVSIKKNVTQKTGKNSKAKGARQR